MFKITPQPISSTSFLTLLRSSDQSEKRQRESRCTNELGVKFIELIFQKDLMKIQGNIILSEALSKFTIDDALAIHRYGQLNPGDLFLWVAVSASSSHEADNALRYIFNQIRRRLSLWERVHCLDGRSYLKENNARPPLISKISPSQNPANHNLG